MTRSRTWNIGAAIVVVLVLVAGWFLAIGPQRSAASEARADTEQVNQQNSITESKIRQLKLEQENLPAQRAEIEQIRRQLPEQPLQPALLRQLADMAAEADVNLANISPAAITPLGGAEGVSFVPLELAASGSYVNLKDFLNALEENRRALLVTGFSISPVEAGADDDVPEGELSIRISARVFMSVPAAVTPGSAAAGDGAPSAGTPTTNGNPAADAPSANPVN